MGLEYSIEMQIIEKNAFLRARADLNEQTLRQETILPKKLDKGQSM